MELTELLPLEKWMELEKEIQARSGLASNVFDTEGIRITGNKVWANNLCSAIKATDKGRSSICAVCHNKLAKRATEKRQTVIESCEAGFMKIVVPIIVDGNIIGSVDACGLLPAGGEVDTVLVKKVMDIKQSEIESLCDNIAAIEKNSAEEVAQFIWEKIEAVVSEG